MNGKRSRTLALLGKVQWRKAEATGSIRYTSDSHGQGVHEGQPVLNEPFPWVGAGRDQQSSQPSALGGAPTAGPR